jgi:hypothetical protein
MGHPKLSRLIALGVFIISLATFLSTVQSSVPFWDCGEFIATAYTMAVPHPPGAPFFLLIGRFMAMVLPFVNDLALRLNLISVITSALAVMFLYLISVRLIIRWRGLPKTAVDYIIVYGSSVIGALTFNFSDTFWFSAVEAEVYAFAMFFLSSTTYLAIRWYEEADQPGSERYLFMIAYLMGLSLGVHQLSILSYFTIGLFVYYRYKEVTLKSFLLYTGIISVTFLILWPGLINWFPDMLDGSFSLGPIDFKDSDLLRYMPLILTLATAYGVYATYKNKNRILNIALTCILLVIIGYSSYTMVVIRSGSHPPINENNPDTMERFVYYMNRSQYGEQPSITERRWNTEAYHQQMYMKYSSDTDYFLRYQIYHMFLRYMGWNFVGKAGDLQDAPAVFFNSEGKWTDGPGFPNKYYGIPLLIGLVGLVYHFRKDWKFALAFLALFMMLGLVLAVYFNMAEPQPRERDYFFVGAFFVFAIWIGFGVTGILEWLEKNIKQLKIPSSPGIILGSTLMIAAVILPVNMCWQNWFDHNRQGNYMPWDTAYNILQSCEKNAILFTGGDNDTFPLWYMQEVEGVRTDIRIVNLSLVNTDWYIMQLKHERPHGADTVTINMSDEAIKRIANMGGMAWTAQNVDLPVPKEVFAEYGVTDTSIVNKGKISWMMKTTLGKNVNAIRSQDVMVKEIILGAKWKRPIYFATSASDDGKIGLDEYYMLEGLAFKLTPRLYKYEGQVNEKALLSSIPKGPITPSKEPQRGYLFRGLTNDDVYFNEQDRRMIVNYRNVFLRLGVYYNSINDKDKLFNILESMEENIPRRIFPIMWQLQADIATLYHRSGHVDRFNEYAGEVETKAWDVLRSGQGNPSQYYNPWRVLLDIYGLRNDKKSQLDVLTTLVVQYPNDQGLKARIKQLQDQIDATAGTPSQPETGNK